MELLKSKLMKKSDFDRKMRRKEELDNDNSILDTEILAPNYDPHELNLQRIARFCRGSEPNYCLADKEV